MYARQHRSAMMLLILALAAFALRWPLDDYMCNPKTWHSQAQKNRKGELIVWRQLSGKEGSDFFSTVFRGGGGTPAIFAMLGGQRYMVANILWNYADVLFHQGSPGKMIQPLESAVTLNPAFTEAWSIYGWHLAWNMHSYTNDLTLKQVWLERGEQVYLRALDSNPMKPKPYFDLAWLYIQRIGDFNEALRYLRYVVEEPSKSSGMRPMSLQEKQQAMKTEKDYLLERTWEPEVFGHRLAYVYKKMGIITGDTRYFDKALATYELCLQHNPKNETAQHNITELKKDLQNPKWIDEQRADEQKNRERYGMTPIDFKASAKAGKQVNIVEDDFLSAPAKDTPAPSSPSSEYYGEEDHHEGDGHNH